MFERSGVGELHIGGGTVGLGGGEDDCVQQLRKSLLEEGREGSEASGRRGGGREEMVGKRYHRKGMGGGRDT